MKNNDEEAPPENKTNTGAHLWITLSGFILLWLTAMRSMSVFDAVVLFLFVACAAWGSIRGGVKEFFSFFGVVASFLVSVNSYQFFHSSSGFDFGTGDPIWGKLCWFLLLLGSCWTVCQILAHYLQNAVAKLSFLHYLNRILGGTLGGLKGLVCGYVFIIVAMGTDVPEQGLGRQFEISCAHKQVKFLEDRYHILESLESMRLSNRLNEYWGRAHRYFDKTE